MAIFYMDVKPIGGNSGRTAVGAAAYHSRTKLYNEKDDRNHDYTNKAKAVGASAYHSGSELSDAKIHMILHEKVMLYIAKLCYPNMHGGNFLIGVYYGTQRRRQNRNTIHELHE